MQPKRASKVFPSVLILLAMLSAACGSASEQTSPINTPTESDSSAASTTSTANTDPNPSPPPSLPLGSEALGSETFVPVVVGHVMGAEIVAHAEPSDSSPVVTELANPTAVGGPLAFQLVERSVPAGEWVEVYLPIRPNGSTGWVAADELEYSANPYRIEIDRAAHQLAIYRGNAEWLTTSVAIGTGGTPTPVGRFYIIELLRPPDPDSLYGPFAFGLSGFSETLTSFAGGAGVIGIHGTNDPTSIGDDVSHGCVRVSNDIIEAMAGVIPLGTPVEIV